MINQSNQKSYEDLERENSELRSKIDYLRSELNNQKNQLDWLKRQLFGRKSEKRIDLAPPEQMNLFADLSEQPQQQDREQGQEQQETNSNHKKRKTKKGGDQGSTNEPGLRFDDDVPLRVIELTPDELKGEDADQYQIIDTRVTRRVAQKTASYEVIEYRRPVIKHIQHNTLKTTPAPEAVFERSIADVSFASGILVDKFAYHLPLYRQHQRLQQAGIYLSRSTLTNITESSAAVLEPIYRAMIRSCLISLILLMDETPVKAGRKVKGKMKQGQFWSIYGDRDEICFIYSPSRGGEEIEKILGDDFQGVLLTDGYAAYEKYAGARAAIIHAQCWAHTRRMFERALGSDPRADEALDLIGELYKTEKSIRERRLDADAALKLRRDNSLPKVREFWAWCEGILHSGLEPKHPLMKAVGYACQRKQALEVFLSNPYVPIDTNHLERSLRPIPMGRRAWNFCWSEVGAQWVGIIQSLITTCRIHGICPYTYLVDVLQRVSSHPASRVEELTPRRWKELFADNPMRSDIDSRAPT